jgi:two-component system nitrate/nitrite response regulator NarP
MSGKKRKSVQRKTPIEVMIAEKNPLLQSGLIRLFAADERFVLVSMAPDGERFLTAAENIRFDVGVIGWEMPYLAGRGVLEAFLRKERNSRLIVYTGSSNPSIPVEAEMLGAWGFCSKSDPGANLLETIAAVADGRKVFPFVASARAVNDPLSSLTPRERELLTALAGGITNAQIAKRFDISLNTVKFHLKNLYEKLSVENRSQAVAFYLSSRKVV